MKPENLDEEWLLNAVANYVARYAAPRATVLRVMRAKIRRAVGRGAVVAADIDAQLAAVIEKHVALGTIDDAGWALHKARGLTRRGVPGSVVRQRLRERGIGDAAPAMAAVAEEIAGPEVEGEEQPATDLVAGCAWARRKRVGPFAREEAADPRAAQQKALGAMARSGYSFDVAKRVLAMDREAAEALLLRLG